MWADDARRMRAMGLEFVRLAEFSWALIEPEAGRRDWAWLDEAIETLADAGLKVMLGTPTATPPKWLIDARDDVLSVDAQGRRRGFGSRRHYCFSSDAYRAEAVRIASAMAARYARNDAVAMWQIDNEYGCHETTRSYSPMARDAFRVWLRGQYQAIDRLNDAWGTVFWSQLYRSFDEIELPNLTVTEANPSHWLDFYRFSSDQVIRFHAAQADAIRAIDPHAIITHNAMGQSFDFDHYALGEQVDILTWDSYPLGFLALSRADQEHKRAYLRQGDPDFAAFHHDLYRGVGRFGVIEQQPGPVNWAPYNPSPLHGMVRLWTLETLAHGGAFSAVFRWRQPRFGQEMNHAGLLRPDNEPAAGFAEIERAAREIASVSAGATHAEVALIFDYETQWMSDIQPQAGGWCYEEIAQDWYAEVRKLGLDIDIVQQGAPLDQYRLVVIPTLFHVRPETTLVLKTTSAQIVIGPRSGSKDAHGRIAKPLPPGPLMDLIPVKVVRSETTPALAGESAAAPAKGSWRLWRDDIETDLRPEICDLAGRPILFRHASTRLFAALPDATLLRHVIKSAATDAGLRPVNLPAGVRIRRTRDAVFAFNYGSQEVHLPNGLGPANDASFSIGARRLPPAGIAAWRTA